MHPRAKDIKKQNKKITLILKWPMPIHLTLWEVHSTMSNGKN
jgi:hypothetical protein